MLSIAICDEDKETAATVKSQIESAFGDAIRCPIKVFPNGDELLAAYCCSRFDIVITEVVLPGTDGISTAKKIKRINKNVIVIFYTSHSEYAIEGYEARAFRYILKSVPKSTFLHQIKAAVREYRSKSKSILITSQRETVSVKVDDLIYAEVFNRIVTVYTMQGNFSYYAQLSRLEDELRDTNVVRTHKSYLVNLEYVKAVGSDYVLLKSGQRLHLSKSCRAAVENALADYCSEN